ncbi:TrbI/VirB10 family protein [Caulobacter sp. 17J80-11]|nr:TrbI/VirB10 family protein [Caulobacter sp. 17J80-11]
MSAPTPAPVVVSPAVGPAAPPQADLSRTGAMIFDNSAPPAPSAPASAGQGTAASGLSADEQFALRTGGDGVPVARASVLPRPDWTVVQGAVIPAVLETALNSDTSGYARAIVSRDVRSFDGSRVLVPRGSRLIGQYRSGLSAGQSRAFVIWNRLVRPDGSSIQLGSPAMDAESAGGLAGQVDRHYAQRYGAAVLLSLVSGLTSGLGRSGDTVVVGAGGAQSAAAEALRADAAIPPTVRVPLGTPIQVFVARDLDFSPQ